MIYWTVPTSILAAVAAVLGVYIAWQQWHTNRQKLKLDLFDRRFEVYLAARELISHMQTTLDVSDEAFRAYRNRIWQSEFLFKPELVKFLREELIVKARQWRIKRRGMGRAIESQNADKTEEYQKREDELEAWTVEADKGLVERFRKYLDFRDVH